MQIVQIDQVLPVVPIGRRPKRSPGVHVSQIIGDLCRTLDPERFDHDKRKERAEAAGRKPLGIDRQLAAEALEWIPEDLDEHPKIWLGSAVDAYLDTMLSHDPEAVSFRPGEMVVDDVAMNADRISLEGPRLYVPGDCGDDVVVEEHKLTWMTSRYGFSDHRFVHWFWQLMAYCWALESLRGRIRPFCINGDYGPPTPPILMPVQEVLFTYDELERNWKKLLRHREVMRRAGRLRMAAA